MAVRKASLSTIFVTVFLDLLGFGLVVPYLPGVARTYGATPFVATLLGAAYSLMQFVFVPIWGRASDRVGRRPVLLASVAASVAGMLMLAGASSLWMLFAARIFSGIATSNLAVAQAYIADVTKPDERAKGMGLIGAGIGLGFILGPVIGGGLELLSPIHRAGALPALGGALLSLVNLGLALAFLPESLPPEKRGKSIRKNSPFDLERYRAALRFPGTGVALALNFIIILSFASLEQTFRLFSEDEFHMTAAGTGSVLTFVGIVLVAVQGGLLRRLARVASERTLVRAGLFIQTLGFAGVALSPRFPGLGPLYAAMGAIAFGSALTNPSLSAFVSKCADPASQGVVLGVLQSAGALARVCGPGTGGLLYQTIGHTAPYFAGAVGMTVAGGVALGLKQHEAKQPADAEISLESGSG